MSSVQVSSCASQFQGNDQVEWKKYEKSTDFRNDERGHNLGSIWAVKVVSTHFLVRRFSPTPRYKYSLNLSSQDPYLCKWETVNNRKICIINHVKIHNHHPYPAIWDGFLQKRKIHIWMLMWVFIHEVGWYLSLKIKDWSDWNTKWRHSFLQGDNSFASTDVIRCSVRYFKVSYHTSYDEPSIWIFFNELSL